MPEIPSTSPQVITPVPPDRHPIRILTASILVASVLHAWISLGGGSHQPIHTGSVVGEVHVRESPTRVAHMKLGGCQAECYEAFVILYVDRSKQPTWTDDVVKVIPWSKIEHLTLK